jgi:iron transport multicopper oxidase
MHYTSNIQIRPPLPVSGLLNDTLNGTANVMLKFTPGKTYKIRVINMGALAPTMIQFDSHTMRVIEIDGEYVHKHDADQIRVSPAQRYTFLLEAKLTTEKNYAFLASFDINRDFTEPGSAWPLNATGYIEYDATKNLPGPYVVDDWNPLDDFTLLVSPHPFSFSLVGVFNPEMLKLISFSHITISNCCSPQTKGSL